MKTILLIILFLASCTAVSLPISETALPNFHPGDSMPDVAEMIQKQDLTIISSPLHPTPRGELRMMYLFDGEDQIATAAYSICNHRLSRIPFGLLFFQSGERMILLLDNDPCDGIIDKVILEGLEGRFIHQDMPLCREGGLSF